MTDDHPSLEELAELDEGLLSPERASELRAHLEGCAECRALADSITTTRALLDELPDEPMPADVIARIDQALADAAPQDSTVMPAVADITRHRRFGRPTAAATAAAAAVVLLLGAVIFGHFGNSTSSGGAAAAGSTAANKAAPNFGGVVPTQPKTFTKTSTGQNYTPTSLFTKIPALLKAHAAATFANGGIEASPSEPVPSGAPTSIRTAPVPAVLKPLYDSRTKVLRCAAALSGIPNAVPIAVDFGRWTNSTYHNAPALFLILRDSDPNQVDVYVTDPTCSGVGQVLTVAKVPLN